MAYSDSIAALPTPASHPMAKPGYGKRSAPDQQPSRPGDFDHLPARAAYIAGFLDRLCENAAMDAKTIAKAQPLYGQAATRSALNELGEAGHLRRVRRRIPPGEGEIGTRWVFLTYWTRTARDNEWWARFLAGDVTDGTDAVPAEELPPAPTAVPPQTATVAPHTSTAYDTLARLGLHEPRLALSATDCAALEQLAADWLARGTTADQLTRILVTALPDQVYSPRAFTERRLRDKMPPELPAPVIRAPRTLMECTDCGVPGRPEALPGGLCRACRGGNTDALPAQGAVLSAPAVHLRADHLRAVLRDVLTDPREQEPIA